MLIKSPIREFQNDGMLDLLSFKRYHDFVTKSCITGDHDRIIRISWSKRSPQRPTQWVKIVLKCLIFKRFTFSVLRNSISPLLKMRHFKAIFKHCGELEVVKKNSIINGPKSGRSHITKNGQNLPCHSIPKWRKKRRNFL